VAQNLSYHGPGAGLSGAAVARPVRRMSRAGAILAPLPGDNPEAVFQHLCQRCAQVLALRGAGLVLILGGTHHGTLGASDARVGAVEELQFMFGEGPCVDAYRTNRLVSESRLASALSRWPGFAPAAVEAGMEAVFSLPVRIGAARFGALDLYQDVPGGLPESDLADAAVVADAAAVLVVAAQADAPPGSLPDAFADLADNRYAVHQATGMVSVQLGVSVEDALVALRARAYQAGMSVGALADEIVARRVRLDDR
jgi:hypothetical protein